MSKEDNNSARVIPQSRHSICYYSGVMASSGSWPSREDMITMAETTACEPRRLRTRIKGGGVRKSAIALYALALTISTASAQTCIPLSGSTQCPAFNASSISTDSSLVGL